MKENLNKGMLIDAVHEKCANDFQSRAAAERAVNAVLDTITDAVGEGREVRLDKFGFFKVVPTAERKGRNPQTQEETIIPAGQKVKFTPSAKMKELASNADISEE